MHLAREFHLGKILFSTSDRQPRWPGALGTHLGAGRVSLAAAAVVAVAGARLGVWPSNRDAAERARQGPGSVPGDALASSGHFPASFV